MIKTLILFATLLTLTACDKDDVWPKDKYRLDSGQVIECRFMNEYECGVSFTDCTGGHTYTCQTNVEVL